MAEASRIEGGRVDEDRLPWLEPVDADKVDSGVGAGKLAVAVVVALVAIGLIVGGLFWTRGGGDEGNGDLIAAPTTPYKTKPDAPGGMQIEGQGDTAYAASEGSETVGRIDVSRLPEEPVEKGSIAAPAPVDKPAAAGATTKVALDDAVATPVAKAPEPKVVPATATAAAVPATGGIQLGAFSSEAKANAAWKALSGRFDYLAPLTMGVQSAESGGKTVYRLRASGPDARSVCAKLKAAGESCTTY